MTRVLVFDDDTSIAELFRAVLEDAGFTVTVATDTHAMPPATFDCIVSDLMGQSAYRFEEARDWILSLQDHYAGVPVVLVTAHHEAKRDQTKLGAWRVIIKPFDVDQVSSAVREAASG